MNIKTTIKTVLIASLMAGAPPAAQAGSEPFIGEVQWFAGHFAPRGWAFCDGQLLPISQNQALFSILGTMYGGDGRTTFALPDVRSRVMIHAGNGPGLSSRRQGERGGQESVTLNVSEMPSHSHALKASGGSATATSPVGNVLASPRRTKVYDSADTNANMDASAITSTGGGRNHNNMQPYNTLSCIIALQGIFPSR